jgi:hypothetical protein
MSEKNLELNDAELARVTGGATTPTPAAIHAVEKAFRAAAEKQARQRALEALRRQLLDLGVRPPI